MAKMELMVPHWRYEMKKHSHLTLDDRIQIQKLLNEKNSFKQIARELGKDPTTIPKEIKGHIQVKKSGCFNRVFNDCRNRRGCTARHLCGNKNCKRACCFCGAKSCASLCPDYQSEQCSRHNKPPYVCNGCGNKGNCTLEKRTYSAAYAQKEYEEVRSEARQGLQITEEEVRRLNSLISPLLVNGQSLHHICVNHTDEIMQNERTLYHYVAAGIFTAKNLDMPRVMRMGKRKKKKDSFKVDKKCRIGRTYPDYVKFMAEQPGLSLVEIDTVEGKKGGKVLLTIHFVVPQLMLAFIRDANTSQSVIDIFNWLYEVLGPEDYRRLFQVILTDNGSEFSNPTALENDLQGNPRSSLFYCDPQASYQKGAVENNHILIRRIIPKGTSLDGFVMEDIFLMMNHINSYARPNLGDKTPYAVFAALYGEELLKKMGVEPIPADKVTLRPSLLKK